MPLTRYHRAMLGILEFRRGGLLGLGRYALRILGTLALHRDLDAPSLRRNVRDLGAVAAPWAIVGGLALGLGAGYGLPGLPGAVAMGRELASTTVQEIAPVVAAGLLVIRGAPRIAAELGVADSPWADGFAAVARKALPPVLGCMVSAVVLWAMFCATAVLSASAAVSDSLGVTPDIFLHRMSVDIQPISLALGGLRSLACGFLVGVTASWEGLRVQRIEDLPQACSAAVMSAFVACVLLELCTGLPLRVGLNIG